MRSHTHSIYMQAECECLHVFLFSAVIIYILMWTHVLTHPACCPLFQVSQRGRAEEEEELHE